MKIYKDINNKDYDYISIENFGTRHRSAFRFCSNYDWAVAFIISQDGGIKVVKKVNDDVILWETIDPMLIGI